MKIKMNKRYWFGFIILVFTSSIFAANLVQVYQQALVQDPTFQQARADWLAAKENIAISRAQVLPQLDLSADVQRQRIKNRANDILSGDPEYYNTSEIYSVNLTQNIFNYAAWAAIRNAKAEVKAAEATYIAAAQDLMIRTAQQYFAVLQARATLRFNRAEKRSVGRQLETTKQRYKVGLIAITDVYEGQASYDRIVATEIEAVNDVANATEDLRAITGVFYSHLKGIKTVKLVRPKPENIEAWVADATKHNFTLLSDLYTAQAAQENISVQAAARYPVIDGIGGYQIRKENNPNGSDIRVDRDDAFLGVQADFPAFQGGLVSASTRQARYQYEAADANYQIGYRDTVTNTRKSYLGILTGISKIRADRQAIISAQSALKSTQAAYYVGTRTFDDVLRQQSSLTEAQDVYSTDQYNYLLDTLLLKQAAGTLSPQDLVRVNKMLVKPVYVDVKIPGTNTLYGVATQGVSPRAQIRLQKPALLTAKTIKAEKYPLSQLSNNTVQQPITATNQYSKSMKQTSHDRFTIQLYSAKEKHEAERFIKHNKLGKKARVLIEHYAKDRLYVVAYGSYDTIKQALAHSKRLPKAVKKQKPWVRRFSSFENSAKN